MKQNKYDDDFKIIGHNYGYYRKRIIADAIHIREKKLDWNVQSEFIRLELFI